MGNNRVRRRIHSQIIVGITTLAVLAFSVGASQASFLNSCTIYCHGIPPRDAARKSNPHFNSQSSAFLGNHRNHLSATPVVADCSNCHTPVALTDFGHGNEIIAMANSLKGYSSANIRAKYDKGVFVNQTSIPNLINATCSNVNCHFETKTPAWGSPAFVAPSSCSSCHGLPPSGTTAAPSGGLAGSHARHDVYFTGATGCKKCHPDYSVFAHATTAGRPLRVQDYLRDPLDTLETGATYSGAGVNYLPSKSSSQLFGSCSTLYCHSNSGPNATAIAYNAATWNSGALTCSSCHADMAIIAGSAPNGNHYVHASTTYTAGAKFACSVCHGAGYTATTITPATHVNRQVELSFTGSGIGTSYSKPAPITAGTTWGSCSAFLCHGSGSPVWGGILWSSADQCGKCHSSTTSGAITQAVPFYSTSFPSKVTLNTDAKVGAHTNHMTSQALGISANTACTDCHGTVALMSATHMNGSTTFVWSNLATRTGTLVPIYTATTGQCTATYCHGNSMPGGDTTGSNKSPIWKDPSYLPTTISSASCGICHGFPPAIASGHPGGITIPVGFPGSATIGTTCNCHANINTAGNSYANIYVDPALHINGILEPASGGHTFPFGGYLHLSAAGTTPWASCITAGCHTNAAGGTYPVATGTPPNCTGCHLNGLRTPSGTSSCWDCHGVSAVDGKPNSNTFPNISGNHNVHMAINGTTCATCHTGGGTGAATHGSNNRVAVTPANVMVAFTGQGTSPLWTFAAKTCSATNCHGQGSPTWGARIGAPVNGFPYSSVQCEKCHGAKTSNPFYSNAIPKVTANSNAKVGAHFMHLTSSTLKISSAVHCNDCHTIPASVTTATHMNGITNFTWSTLASKGGTLIPTYTTATGVCANVYCHGAGMPGGDTSGTNRAPTWNSTTYLPATIGAGGTACKVCHGFPPLTASGHPTLTTAIPATFGNGTVAIGASCSCHANINTTGTTYANIFVNKAQHIDGTLQVSGGHDVPYDNHKADIVAAGGNTACLGCHAMGTAASPYPAAVVGNPPDCMSCHRKAVPLHTGTTAGANCSSCHGLNTGTGVAIGRPVGTAYPDRLGFHGGASDTAHRTSACTVCHSGAGTTSGNNSGINHGKGSTAGPVRDGKPNVVGPMVNGITPTNSAKGVGTPAGGTTCVHGTISSGCSSGGTKSNSW